MGDLSEPTLRLREWHVAPDGKLVINLTQAPREEDLPRLHDAVNAFVGSLAARAEGPAQVSAPLDREGVARIIDPLTWGKIDAIMGGSMDDRLPEGWGRERFAVSCYYEERQDSLAKADAILALSQQDQVGLTTPAVLGEPSGDDWIDWNGGDIPVSGKVVKVLFRDSTIGTAYAHHLFWSHTGKVNDIIAYRVVSPPPPAGGVK